MTDEHHEKTPLTENQEDAPLNNEHEASTEESDIKDEYEGDIDRRDMLASAVRFSSVLGLFGLSVETLFTDEAEAKRRGVNTSVVKRLITEALERGDMEAAITKFGARSKLSSAQLNQLRTISSRDLKTLKRLRNRFKNALKGIATVEPWGVHEHNAYRRRK